MKRVFFMLLLIGCSKFSTEQDLSLPESVNIPQEVQEVLYYSSLAPSGHNTQMWKVSHSDGQLAVSLDNTRLLKAVDPYGREAYIGLGAFIETMRQAFTAYGYDTEINIGETTIVSYKKVNNKINTEVLEIIKRRHTEKSNFLDKQLDDSVMDSVLSSDNIKYYAKGVDLYMEIAVNSKKAFAQQANNPEKRIELADWMRFSDKEAKVKKDGLPAEQLGMTGIKKIFYYIYVDKEKAISDSFAKQSISIMNDQIDSSAGFIVLFCNNKTISDKITCGMNMQNLWLSLTKQGVSVHPISQILEEEPFAANFSKMFNINPDSDLEPMMVFRAGYVKKYGNNNLIRRPITEFIIHK